MGECQINDLASKWKPWQNDYFQQHNRNWSCGLCGWLRFSCYLEAACHNWGSMLPVIKNYNPLYVRLIVCQAKGNMTVCKQPRCWSLPLLLKLQRRQRFMLGSKPMQAEHNWAEQKISQRNNTDGEEQGGVTVNYGEQDWVTRERWTISDMHWQLQSGPVIGLKLNLWNGCWRKKWPLYSRSRHKAKPRTEASSLADSSGFIHQHLLCLNQPLKGSYLLITACFFHLSPFSDTVEFWIFPRRI